MNFEKYISTINNLINFPELNNAAAIGQIIIDMITELKTDLPTIETALRKSNSKIYLVGLPLKFYGPNYSAIFPKQTKCFDFALWIGLNGPEEITHLLEKNNISLDDTDISLLNTGFLTIK